MSVLGDMKTLLNIPDDVTSFDNELMIHINSVLMTLEQLIDVDQVFISSQDDDWVVLGNIEGLQALKSYVYTKVRLLFDPPQSSYLLTALEKNAAELEWRLIVQNSNNVRKGYDDG